MSRLGIFACLLMLAAVAVCLDMPPNMKPGEPAKDGQGHPPPGHPQHPDGPRPDGQHPDAPRQEGQPPKDNPKSEAKPQQEQKS